MKQGVLSHGRVYLLLRRSILGIDQGELASRYVVDANVGVLNLFIVKTKRKVFLDEQILQCLVGWKPKELAESKTFSVSL